MWPDCGSYGRQNPAFLEEDVCRGADNMRSEFPYRRAEESSAMLCPLLYCRALLGLSTGKGASMRDSDEVPLGTSAYFRAVKGDGKRITGPRHFLPFH